MNFSVDRNVTHISLKVRDTFVTALTKNIIVVALWISINYINGTFVHTFFKHEIFNVNPRYILFIHLVINDMIQLTIAVFLHVISYILFTINVSLCSFLLMIAIFTTLNTPVNLATMALERYIAICIPLRHSQICTVHRTYILIGIIWIMAAIPILPDLFILLATERLQFFHSKIFCSRDSLFRNPYLIEKKNISHAVYLTVVWFTLFYTYFRIMFTAKAANADAKKARNTILLHAVQLLMCMFTYIGPLIDSLLLYIFSTHALEIQFTSYVIVHILPRFISPIVYGLRDQTFRKYLKRYLICTATPSLPRLVRRPIKQRFRKTRVNTLSEIAGVMKISTVKGVSIPQLVGLEYGTVLVESYGWHHCTPYFRPLPQIKHFNALEPGVVTKERSDSVGTRFQLLRNADILPPIDASTVENEWMMVKKSGIKRAKVGNEQQFMVGVRFTSKNVFWGDLFAVSKMVKDEFGVLCSGPLLLLPVLTLQSSSSSSSDEERREGSEDQCAACVPDLQDRLTRVTHARSLGPVYASCYCEREAPSCEVERNRASENDKWTECRDPCGHGHYGSDYFATLAPHSPRSSLAA
ncbi:uncharacterized protein [Salvelinus sp. IW2-2015]|uniref:uncharacterized protein n=1 Tax=Salvelinus sp. IW2-2015 TaxID=2691554 RepID=UPI0038D507AB